MALLINKLFSSKKKSYGRHQDVCERAFSFSKEQVRIVLFRECDFRGRKLLFDSQTVQKISVTTGVQNKTSVMSNANAQCAKSDIYVEISNGYGYQYTRPSGDTVHLGEMIFGSVAMSFRGTSFKIHSFSSPPKLMCTQVFPSPKITSRGRVSITSNLFPMQQSTSSMQSLEKSGKLDYSSASSTTSFNEQSGQSTDSDIKIVPCSSSVPLDVPLFNTGTSAKLPSLEGDSGFCGEQSYSSVSSGPHSITVLDGRLDHVNGVAFSCGSLYKRWLRSASTSLDYSSYSDSSLSGVHSSASADECMIRNHHRSSKLGLAIIVQLSDSQQQEMESFLLKHAALVEAMVCRARAGAETAYMHPGSFASLMYDIYQETCRWFSDLLTGTALETYLWHAISQGTSANKSRDSSTKNGSFLDFTKTRSESNLLKVNSSSDINKKIRTNLFSNSTVEVNNSKLFDSNSLMSSVHRSFSGLAKGDTFKNDGSKQSLVNLSAGLSTQSSLFAENFIKELCELLESVDVKHTNFFISTLLTAVLTHHLGWVSTVCPPSQADRDIISKLHSPCNPLWGQLSDLYGAVGHPTKMSRTIVCGNNKGDIITRILNILTYFIRCSSVERNNLTDFSVCDFSMNISSLEKKVLNSPKSKVKASVTNSFKDTRENTKAKEEQLEMATLKIPSVKLGGANVESALKRNDTKSESGISTLETGSLFKSKGLKKNKSCLGDLCLQSEMSNNFHDTFDFNTKDNDFGGEINFSFKTNKRKPQDETDSNVVFVLGENEELIGLKKNKTNISSENEKLNIPSSSNSQRPKDLQLPKKLFNCESSDSSPDDSSSSNCTGLCADLSPCSECEKIRKRSGSLQPGTSKEIITHSSTVVLEKEFGKENVEIRRREGFDRSQSVPPSDKNKRKCSKSGCKKKYSGVKFDIRQYPQIVTNYMKSKDLELSQLPFGEKALKLNRSFSTTLYDNCFKYDFPSCDCEPHDTEALQTPSNASELEFTSDLEIDKYETHSPSKRVSKKESVEKKETKPVNSVDTKTEKAKVENTVLEHPLQDRIDNENNAIFEHDIDAYEKADEILEDSSKMVYMDLPLPSISVEKPIKTDTSIGYTRSLLRGIGQKYISDMVLQGTTAPQKNWEHILKRDLVLTARQPLLDQPIQEAVGIVANTDTWEVQLVSSHSYIVERGCAGVRVCLSQLVANMLESLLHMWKLKTPSEYCLMHIEARLREVCMHSKALAQLLLSTEFCNMDSLTSALQLEVNDMPLLMSVASTHTPQVTQKYGLSFQ